MKTPQSVSEQVAELRRLFKSLLRARLELARCEALHAADPSPKLALRVAAFRLGVKQLNLGLSRKLVFAFYCFCGAGLSPQDLSAISSIWASWPVPAQVETICSLLSSDSCPQLFLEHVTKLKTSDPLLVCLASDLGWFRPVNVSRN